MKHFVKTKHKDLQSRVTYVRLIDMQLRLLELWRVAAGGHQEALVQMAVGAITGSRFTRSGTDQAFKSMTRAIPVDLMTKCNLSSISTAIGLNRETVRRIVNRLITNGRLVRAEDGSINFAPGWTQGPEATQLNEGQLSEFRRTVNLLIEDDVLSIGEE